ncbi:UNVERIFIED_CONTAM: hypothetical protein GTU68_022895 [Idotea baltica]|nr:hypothetical protein [Idotea baltica]
MIEHIPHNWQDALQPELQSESWQQLQTFLNDEYQQQTVFPAQEDLFTALKLTALANVKVVILGQDPYHDDGQAHGLSFSVRRGIKIPPSLRNIFKELAEDIDVTIPNHGCLEAWARQGVLLLNTVLSVRAHEANSHRKQGWEQFTDGVIRAVNEQPAVVFVLWGNPAQKKAELIDETRHLVLKSAHPSPLSARRGFIGSQPFSKINDWLQNHGSQPIDWLIENSTNS